MKEEYRVAEERERRCMDILVSKHPHLSGLIHTPVGSFSHNDGWISSAITSAITLHIVHDTKVRAKHLTDPIYINATKHYALTAMAAADGSTPVLFDYCRKGRAMLVVDLSAPGWYTSAITYYHRIERRKMTAEVVFYPASSIIDVYPRSVWLSGITSGHI